MNVVCVRTHETRRLLRILMSAVCKRRLNVRERPPLRHQRFKYTSLYAHVVSLFSPFMLELFFVSYHIHAAKVMRVVMKTTLLNQTCESHERSLISAI